MINIIFFGDHHGCSDTFLYMINKMTWEHGKIGVDCTLSVGDIGIGFRPYNNDNYLKNGKTWAPEIDYGWHKWIRGNHDDPNMCKLHSNYLGNFGYIKKADIFFISGGLSIDKEYRIENISWWKDEELNYEQTMQCIEEYINSKPRIVVSHECPTVIKYDALTNILKSQIASYTEKLLQNLYELHQPEYWIFGHHHNYIYKKYKNTTFVGLDEIHGKPYKQSTFELPNIEII